MNKSKKILSVFLSALMLISFMPLFASAASIKLTRTNIEIVAPSVSPSEICYGQTLGELTITGGEMWYVDGTGAKILVPGYFTVYNTTIAPAASESYEVYLKFVPTDENYTCTATFRSSNSTFTGTWPTIKVTSVGVAKLSETPVASSIIGGSSLDNSILSGGKIVDENGNDITSLGTWKWDDNSQIVTENSAYKATWTAAKNAYNSVTADVNVAVAYNVVTQPTLSSLSYEYFKDFSTDDLEIIPGVVKAADGVADILGTYEFEKTYKFTAGTFNLNIVFIPEDSNLPTYKTSVAIEITKGDIIFSEDVGNENIPELTMPYGTKLDSDFARTLAEYVNIGENVWIYYRDIDGNEYDYSGTTPGLGTHTYKVTAVPYSSTSNYKATELEFKLTIEPLEVTPSITAYGNDKYMISTDDYTKKPRGTYDLYVDGELAIEDIKYQEEFIWRPEKSGTYNLKAVYNPVENDTYKVNDAVREDFELKLKWEINCTNCTARSYAYGETATVSHMLGDQFAGWVFYDENGKEFTPENMVEYSSYVTFTMPDFSFSVRAKIIGEADDSGNDGNNSGSGNADSTSIFGRFFEYLRSLFEKFINIVKTIFGMFVPVN